MHRPQLPPDLWAHILATSGPMRLCCSTGSDATFVAACRIQRSTRASLVTRHLLRPGARVRVRYNAADPWLRGAVVAVPCFEKMLAVQIETGAGCAPGRHIFFLPSATLRVRVERPA
jgi:hypothetical protein